MKQCRTDYGEMMHYSHFRKDESLKPRPEIVYREFEVQITDFLCCTYDVCFAIHWFANV